jgi:hypothetical protein
MRYLLRRWRFQSVRRLAPQLIPAAIVALVAAALILPWADGRPAGGNSPMAFVVGNAALARVSASAAIAHRVGYYAAGDAPELPYVSQAGSCGAHGMANDGGACVNAEDGSSWKAVFPSGRIDIRQFGAKPDNSAPADAAVAAANAYSSAIGACTYVPSVYPGFTFRKPITLSGGGSDCLIGDRGIKNFPPQGGFGKFADLSFPNDSDGIIVSANNGWYVGALSIKGHAAQSASPLHTAGITIDGTYEGKVTDLFVQDFAICKRITAPSNRFVLHDIFCDDQSGYPNVTNDYPFACTEMEAAGRSGAVAAFQEIGGECRAAAGAAGAVYIADGITTWYQVCAPVTFAAGLQRTGAPLGCAGPTEYGMPLWRADGIKVRVGSGTRYANGQSVANAPLKVCGVDYTIWDVSAAGGGGSAGKPLYCNRISASVEAGNATVAVASTAGIPAGTNILATANHGLPVAAKVERIVDGTHLALSKAPYVTGTLTLDITQIAIATSGPPAYLQGCQTAAGQASKHPACGYKLEIRFNVPPARDTPIELQWSDPTGYAAYLADTVSDYVFLRPLLIGGWDVGLKHVGLSDGGIEFRPTYIELLNRCVAIEHHNLQGGGISAPYGDVIDLHRVINDPIPDCPGYVDPSAGPTIVTYNNVRVFLNGARSGGGR